MFIFKKKSSKLINNFDKITLDKGSLRGNIRVSGDKSISQRALIIGLASIGETVIEGILDSEDVFYTLKAVEALGAKINIKKSQKLLTINGVGIGNLVSPKKPIYMGNSGTGARLLIGLVAGSNATVTFYGDDSLSNRPMDRIIDPLKKMGASFILSGEKKLPITVIGARVKGITMPIKYKTPVASAQIKSAIIFAGLTARGITCIEEPYKSRNYTEKMLKKCGVVITSKINKKFINTIKIKGKDYLKNCNFLIPGDPSSAAFIVVAALIMKGSKVKITNILNDNMRLKVFKILQKMGGKIKINKISSDKCEIIAEYSYLKNIHLKKNDSTSLIDEFPILSIAAACGKGKMVMRGLGELRFKESDRFAAISQGLKKCGVDVKTYGDDIEILGAKKITGDSIIHSNKDHRVAMSFNVLNLVVEKPIKVIGNDAIISSFPNFFCTLKSLKHE
tara:strand:- start:34277 stop:35626 length:1350 start_codon:yes stop_codon:yes gene_type:complete